jgi:hypothetical protein
MSAAEESGGGDSGRRDPSSRGLRSAYEAALSRLESQGISRPDEGALSDSTREAIAEARRRAEAKLAELEIMHRDKLAGLRDPMTRGEAEEHYRRDRQRTEEALERELAKLRDSG